MKALISLVLLLSLQVKASEVAVFELEVPFGHVETTAEFDLDRESGNAWISVLTTRHWGPQGSDQVIENTIKVDGLSFDNATNEIVWNGISCAKVQFKGRGIFKRTIITNTNCDFTVTEFTRAVDNGYRVRKLPHVRITLSGN